jgi:hypothetical protein
MPYQRDCRLLSHWGGSVDHLIRTGMPWILPCVTFVTCNEPTSVGLCSTGHSIPKQNYQVLEKINVNWLTGNLFNLIAIYNKLRIINVVVSLNCWSDSHDFWIVSPDGGLARLGKRPVEHTDLRTWARKEWPVSPLMDTLLERTA